MTGPRPVYTGDDDSLLLAVMALDNEELITKTGRVLTDADIEALADEAESGYDVGHLAWRNVTQSSPANGIVVEVANNGGTHLRRSGNLWFLPDGSMYVYYTPTLWRPI